MYGRNIITLCRRLSSTLLLKHTRFLISLGPDGRLANLGEQKKCSFFPLIFGMLPTTKRNKRSNKNHTVIAAKAKKQLEPPGVLQR